MEEVGKTLLRLEGLITALDQKMDRRFDQVESRFFWMMGIQFSILIAIIVGLIGIVTKVV